MKAESIPNPFLEDYRYHETPPFCTLQLSTVANEWFAETKNVFVDHELSSFKDNVELSCADVRVLETHRTTERLSLGNDYNGLKIVAKFEVIDLYGVLQDDDRNEVIRYFRQAAYNIACQLKIDYVQLTIDGEDEYYTAKR